MPSMSWLQTGVGVWPRPWISASKASRAVACKDEYATSFRRTFEDILGCREDYPHNPNHKSDPQCAKMMNENDISTMYATRHELEPGLFH